MLVTLPFLIIIIIIIIISPKRLLGIEMASTEQWEVTQLWRRKRSF